MVVIHIAALVLNVINIIILLVLFTIYWRNYRHIKSKFNLGLVVFSLLFILENLIAFNMGVLSWEQYEHKIILDILIFNIVELLALGSLVWITRE